MKKAKIMDIVATCLANRRLCRVFCRYDANYWYYFPLIVSEKLLLGAGEDDFIIDGYTIRRFRDITKAEIRDDMCETILKKEGIVDQLVIPAVEITSWETTFLSLQTRNQNIIIRKESLEEEKCIFVIGRIEKVLKKYAYVRHFDADGIWQDEPYRIPYKEITSITFGSRYVDIFSKYLSELPDDFGKQ